MNKTGFYTYMTYVLYKSVNLYKSQILARKYTLVRNCSLVVFLSRSEEVVYLSHNERVNYYLCLIIPELVYPSLFVRIIDGLGLRGCRIIYAKFLDSD